MTYRMEPLTPDDPGHALADIATDLVAKTNRLAGRLHPVLRSNLGDLLRSMNCYYSNLIEGHNTHPVDIDRALAGEYAEEPHKRDLQREAVAHIDVQRRIDRNEAPRPAVGREFILWTHRRFCEQLPDDLLWVTDQVNSERIRVEPGVLRQRQVRVGNHVPPPPDELDAFLSRFEAGYGSGSLSRLQRIVAVAASHHRLLWIHPFLDGNGRVARLFSHALLRELEIGSELWSVSRGLARNVASYKMALASADQPRRGDLDGRGNLSAAGLTEFCTFFLETCVDQVTFMEGLLEPAELLRRIEIWCEEEVRARRLARGSWSLLREAVIAGEFARGKAASLTGYEVRQARSVLGGLLDQGLLASDTPRGPVRLGFPIKVVERWFPRLYPGI